MRVRGERVDLFGRFWCASSLALTLYAFGVPIEATQKTSRPGKPPEITSEPPSLARIGVVFEYDVAATDRDAGDTLTFALPKKPAGAAIDANSGLIHWTPTVSQLGNHNFRVRVSDSKGLTDDQEFSVLVLHVLEVDPVISPTNQARILISGNAGDPNNRIRIDGGLVPVVVAPGLDRRFAAGVPLHENSLNRLFVSEITMDGTAMPPVAAPVVQDVQPPNVFIDFPPEGAELTGTMTDVAGRVGDLLSGFMGLHVVVNGVMAEVDVGIGNNGTFLARNVPLAVGDNVIKANATDALGNSVTRQRSIHVAQIPEGAPFMMMMGGNQQSARIHELLQLPIHVQVFHGDGSFFTNKIVSFEVTRSDGRLNDMPMPGGALLLQARTDSMGIAEAYWTLGGDAGCGNNRVEARSTGIAGTVFFCASAMPGAPVQINIGSGNNQRVESGSPAREPLRAWVSDGCNGVGGIPVTFNVSQGNGTVNGQTSVTVPTFNTGHAAVEFVLGTEPGKNVVEASYSQNEGSAATFVAYGVRRVVGQPTSLEGLVLNNASQPIAGATVDLVIGSASFGPVQTTIEGQFRFEDITAGPAHIHVNGLTATHVGGSPGMPIPQGTFPGLPIEITIVPNAANSLPMPVLLPALNPNNARLYDGTTDVELKVEGIEGLKMTVRAGSMINPDRTVPSPENPAILSLNQVHHDDVPMPMPDGAAPPFAWTLQPADAHFDPPIEVEYPNMTGLPPGGIAYFLSFNHGTNRFEIVASGHVTPMGDKVVSDDDAGIPISGWGCNCPPYSVTAECEDECQNDPDIRAAINALKQQQQQNLAEANRLFSEAIQKASSLIGSDGAVLSIATIRQQVAALEVSATALALDVERLRRLFLIARIACIIALPEPTIAGEILCASLTGGVIVQGGRVILDAGAVITFAGLIGRNIGRIFMAAQAIPLLDQAAAQLGLALDKQVQIAQLCPALAFGDDALAAAQALQRRIDELRTRITEGIGQGAQAALDKVNQIIEDAQGIADQAQAWIDQLREALDAIRDFLGLGDSTSEGK
jgi:hypothetical protein